MAGWPQRPGWRSSTNLLHAETGTKINLGAMPPEGVARCRADAPRPLGAADARFDARRQAIGRTARAEHDGYIAAARAALGERQRGRPGRR